MPAKACNAHKSNARKSSVPAKAITILLLPRMPANAITTKMFQVLIHLLEQNQLFPKLLGHLLFICILANLSKVCRVCR